MTQFRVIAAVAITGMVAAMPAAAQGKSGTRGASGLTTHGKPTTTSGATQTTTTHGKSGTEHGRPRSSTTTTTTTTTTTNALSTKISSNPNQLARITAMLPEGMTIEQATAGFRNQGQFIAALNASKNQGVNFVDLQKAMTEDGLSLGQAVRTLKQTTPETESTTPATTGSTTTETTTSSTTNAS